ncbi:MAG: lysylphosphatidylglycerol synthase transmembrane domain-containing protein [Geminicoccaceae bacterium]
MTLSTRRLLRFAVAFTLVGYLIQSVPADELIGTLGRAHPTGIVLALVLALASHLVIAERIRCVTQALGLVLPFWALFKINLSAVFYGLALPAGNLSGVAARLYQMARAGGQYAEPAVALTLERLVATVTLGAIGVVFWFADPLADVWPVLLLMLAATLGFAALQLAIFQPLPLITPLWQWLVGRWPRKLAPLRDAMERARSMPWRISIQLLGLGIVVHLIGIAAYGAVAWSLDLELSVSMIGWTRSAAILVAILPVSVAGLGLREGALVVLLAPYGIDGASAVAYGLLAFATTIFGMAVVGGVIEGRRWLATSTS